LAQREHGEDEHIDRGERHRQKDRRLTKINKKSKAPRFTPSTGNFLLKKLLIKKRKICRENLTQMALER
jgi:hypothetical protein